MEIERAIEILNPEHREHYDSIETVNEACRMGMRALGKEKEKNKMEKIKVMLDEGAKMPTRAHDTDAGYDLYSRDTIIVGAKKDAIFDTGVHIQIPAGYVGFLKSKSGLNCKFGIVGEGVIDAGYMGSIRVKLYNHSGRDVKFSAGDKLIQLVLLPIFTPDLELADVLDATERGDNGFGSSGK